MNNTHIFYHFSFLSLLLISAFISTSNATVSTIKCSGAGCAHADFDSQESSEKIGQSLVSGETEAQSMGQPTRILSGPGSVPPSCVSKCGKCTPCTPILVSVSVQPPVEYPPRVWKCKCGNKLNIGGKLENVWCAGRILPDSVQPSCNSVCEKCKPIIGSSVSLADYYPSDWKCKCGNNLYDP